MIFLRAGQTRPSIKQIAFIVGYSPPEDFCREFRRRMGLRPSQWQTAVRHVALRDGHLDPRRWRDPEYMGYSKGPDGTWQPPRMPPPTPWAV